jgi:hypothetical protein
MPGASLAAHRHAYGHQPEEHVMYDLNDLNPDVMRSELAYRNERLGITRRVAGTALTRRLRSRQHKATSATR